MPVNSSLWIIPVNWVSKVSCSLGFVRNAFKAEGGGGKEPQVPKTIWIISAITQCQITDFFFFKCRPSFKTQELIFFFLMFLLLQGISLKCFFNRFLQSHHTWEKFTFLVFTINYIKEFNELCWALSLVLTNCIKMKLIYTYIIKILKSHPLGEHHIRGIRLSPYEPNDQS